MVQNPDGGKLVATGISDIRHGSEVLQIKLVDVSIHEFDVFVNGRPMVFF